MVGCRGAWCCSCGGVGLRGSGGGLALCIVYRLMWGGRASVWDGGLWGVRTLARGLVGGTRRGEQWRASRQWHGEGGWGKVGFAALNPPYGGGVFWLFVVGGARPTGEGLGLELSGEDGVGHVLEEGAGGGVFEG